MIQWEEESRPINGDSFASILCLPQTHFGQGIVSPAARMVHQVMSSIPARKRPTIASRLKVPNLGRRRLVVVIASIVIGNGAIHQLSHIHIFEAIPADGVGLSTQTRIFSPVKMSERHTRRTRSRGQDIDAVIKLTWVRLSQRALISFNDFGRETPGLGNAKRLHFQL